MRIASDEEVVAKGGYSTHEVLTKMFDVFLNNKDDGSNMKRKAMSKKVRDCILQKTYAVRGKCILSSVKDLVEQFAVFVFAKRSLGWVCRVNGRGKT